MTVQIGKLTDTPDTGDPIVSPWYQEIALYARHIFATRTELDTQWADAPDGAHAYTTAAGEGEWVRIGGVWKSGPRQIVLHGSSFNFASFPVGTGGEFFGVTPILKPAVRGYDRIFEFEVSALITATSPFDLAVMSDAAILKRVRSGVNGTAVGFAFSMHVAAGAAIPVGGYGLKINAISGTSTISTGGGSDLNWINIVELPIVGT